MKKMTYVSPEVELIAISTEDVCTLSLTGEDKEDWEKEEAEEQGLV
ncbi:MAG: hypothetical protein IKA44_03785 [Clostridia bacterium]|nr:hypothetical protein [Clostridia bacterium]